MSATEKIRLLSSGDRLAVPSNINKIIVIDLEKGVWQTQNTGHDNNLQVNCNDISVRIYHSCDLFDVTLHYTYSINNTNKIYLNGLQTSMINKLHLLDEEIGLAFIMISGTSISACREDNGLCLIIDKKR